MFQSREDEVQYDRPLSRASNGDGDDESQSNLATCGSSDRGSEDLETAQIRPQSPERGLRLTPTRRLLRGRRIGAGASTGVPDLARGTESHQSSSLRDLMSPLSPVNISGNKRSLDEVLKDNKPPQKDKLSAEIELLANELPRSDAAQAGPSGTNRWEAAHSHHRKKSRGSKEPSASQPTRTVDTNAQGVWQERLPERVRGATGSDSQSSSGD